MVSLHSGFLAMILEKFGHEPEGTGNAQMQMYLFPVTVKSFFISVHVYIYQTEPDDFQYLHVNNVKEIVPHRIGKLSICVGQNF